MKILQATFIRGVAGSENFLMNTIRGLKERGHQIDVLILYLHDQETVEFCKILQEESVRFFKINIKGGRMITNLPRIGKLIKQYDVTNSHLLHADFTISLAKKFFAKKAVLISGKHGYEEWYTHQFGFDPEKRVKNRYWKIARLAEKQINESFTISNGLLKLFIGLDICKSDKIKLIYYGFDFKNDFRHNDELRLGNPQLCIVGRLTAYKGHLHAIRALSTLVSEFPDIKLLIIGWGELEAKLKSEVKDLKLEEHILFLGRKMNAREYMFNSDIVLVPSISEGFGIVIAEAMSVKKPVVAFDVSSPNELLENNVSGILTEPFNERKYAENIRELILDEKKREQVAENAYHTLKSKFTLERMIDQIEKTYLNYAKSAK